MKRIIIALIVLIILTPRPCEAFIKKESFYPYIGKCFFYVGEYYLLTDDYEKAIKNYTRAIGLNPNAKQAYFKRGSIRNIQMLIMPGGEHMASSAKSRRLSVTLPEP